MNNNLPPASQPWVRTTETLKASTRKRVQSVSDSLEVQQFEIGNALALLPDRIAELEVVQAALPVPLAGTQLDYDDTLDTLTPNTWKRIQDYTLAAPPGKTNASVMAIVTGYVRAVSGTTTNYNFIRAGVNGTMFAETPMARDGSGVGIAANSYTGVGSVSVQTDFKATVPSEISNDPARPNAFRLFFMVVWS